MRKKNYRALKKAVCLLMTGAMILTGVPTGMTWNGYVKEVLAEEASGEVVENEYDVNAPVVETANLVEDGQNLNWGDTFSVTFKGYDVEGSISSEGYCHLVGETSDFARTATSVVYDEAEDLYTMTFGTGELYEEWYTLDYIRVLDDSGNYSIYQMADKEQKFCCNGNGVEKIYIKNVTLSQSEVVLTEDNMEQTIEIIIDAECSAGFDENESYEISWSGYSNESNYSISCDLNYNFDSEKFVGTMSIHKHCGGTYHFSVSDIYAYKGPFDKIDVVSDDIADIDITVKREFPADYSCIVEDMYFTLNGERVENGFSAQEGDEVKFVAVLSEMSVLDSDDELSNTIYVGDNSGFRYIQLNEQGNGVYEADVSIVDLNATEINVGFCCQDIYGNIPKYQEGVDEDCYFYLYKDDTCEIPTIQFNVNFTYISSISEEGVFYEYTYENVSAKRITSLKEMFPDGLPVAPEVDGIEFLGWSIDGELVNEDTVINVYELTSDYYGLTLNAVYDKLVLILSINYCPESSESDYYSVPLILEKGTTYEDVLNMITEQNLFEIEHDKNLVFKQWNMQRICEQYTYEDINEEIDSSAVIADSIGLIGISAKYDKIPVRISFEYVNKDNEISYFSEILFLDESMTLAELTELFNVYDIEHTEKVNFLHWDCAGIEIDNWWYDETDENININNNTFIRFRATYDRAYVDVRNEYVKEGNIGIWSWSPSKVCFIEEGATYAEILLNDEMKLDHTKAAHFLYWDFSYNGDIDLDKEIENGAYFERRAVYDKSYIDVFCDYISNNSERGTSRVVFIDENATYRDILDAMVYVELPHTDAMVHTGWSIYKNDILIEDDMLDEVYEQGSYLTLKALYEISNDSEYTYTLLYDKTLGITGYKGSDTEITIPSEISGTKVSAICNYAFEECEGLKEITLPESISFIESHAFSSCNTLEAINVSDENNDYKSIDGILFDKSGTEIVRYPAGKTGEQYTIPDGVTSIAALAFAECDKLVDIKLPNDLKYIFDQAFSDCTGLTSVIIPDNVECIGDWAFDGCSSLQSITIPDSVTDIGSITFNGCSSLTEIHLPEGIDYIGDYIFMGCSSLTEINIPEGVTVIGAGAFDGCSKLTEVDIPESVTNICYSAFKDCSSLTAISIPNGVKEIYDYTFVNCDSLKEIKIPKSVEKIAEHAIGYCYSYDTNEYTQCTDLVIYGYAGTAAETYAADNGFEFVTIKETSDEEKNIVVEYPEDAVTGNVDLQVNELTENDESYKNLNLEEKLADTNVSPEDMKFKVYDIKLLDEETNDVQPTGEVTVKLPCPEGYETEKCKVYHIDAEGNVTDMNAVYDGEYFVFTTNHFSVYLVTENTLKTTPEYISGDVNDDGNIDTKDAVLLKKYLAGYTDLEINEDACDVNKDGNIDSADAVILLKHLAGYEGMLE